MIYYVEDDESIRNLVVYTLTQVGMPAQGFSDAAEFRLAMKKELPELILLDVMLPSEDGLRILRDLRADSRTAMIPTIMLTAKGTEFDRVMGLDLGADDYIVKPFGIAELIARVRARLRNHSADVDNSLLISDALTLDRRAHDVRVNGESIALTMKEYDLLCLLMENRGVAFRREQLLNRIWDSAYDGGTRTVDVHIQTLRAKLGVCGGKIETVRGIGYRFGG